MGKLILIILLFFSSCSINKFIDRENFIDKLPSTIPADSIHLLDPAFTVWYHEKDFDYAFPSNSRPDTFVKYLREAFSKTKISNNLNGAKNSGCLSNKNDKRDWRSEFNYDYEKHKCLSLLDGYNVFLNVKMNISTVQGNMGGAELETINCYLNVIKDGKVLYYKNFSSVRDIKNNRFPKDSTDRKDYPYFANDQIERVVKNITADLIKRIGPAAK